MSWLYCTQPVSRKERRQAKAGSGSPEARDWDGHATTTPAVVSGACVWACARALAKATFAVICHGGARPGYASPDLGDLFYGVLCSRGRLPVWVHPTRRQSWSLPRLVQSHLCWYPSTASGEIWNDRSLVWTSNRPLSSKTDTFQISGSVAELRKAVLEEGASQPCRNPSALSKNGVYCTMHPRPRSRGCFWERPPACSCKLLSTTYFVLSLASGVSLEGNIGNHLSSTVLESTVNSAVGRDLLPCSRAVLDWRNLMRRLMTEFMVQKAEVGVAIWSLSREGLLLQAQPCRQQLSGRLVVAWRLSCLARRRTRPSDHCTDEPHVQVLTLAPPRPPRGSRIYLSFDHSFGAAHWVAQ